MAKNGGKKATKNVAGDVVKKAMKNATGSDVKKAAKNVAGDVVKKAANNATGSDVKKAAKNVAGNVVKKATKNATGSDAKKAAKDVAGDEALDAEKKQNDAADSVEEGLKAIQSKPEGILQSELWKELGVDSRKCSRIVKKLEECGLIEREDFKKDGIKTYLLRAKKQPVNPGDLLAGDELIPCIGCELECIVEECHPLMDWMYQLAIVEHTEE